MRSLCASAVVCAAFTACAPATSSQQQAVILGPLADYTFPDTVIGSISPPYTYTLQDRSGLGVQMDTITAIHASCPGFMFTTLPPVGTVISITLGGSDGSNWTTMNAAITVAFAPTSQGTDTCTFYVVFNNGIDDDSLCNTDANHLCANLTGTGIEPPMVFGESPDPVDFGDVALGTSATPITYTMTNGGSGPNDPILESATFVPDVNNVLSWIPPPLPATISHGGGKLAFTLNCTHPVEGPNNGMMSFHFMPQTPDVTPKDYMVMVSCTGKDTTLQFEPAPVLITGPPEQTSGCMRVGDTDTIPLTLHNLGAQPIQISTVMFDDPSEFSFATGSDPSATMLGGSADLPTSVVYTPVRATTSGSGSGSGSSSSSDSVTIATLTVNHDSTMSDQVTFQGCAVAAKMSVSPGDNYDVGPVCTNTNTTKTVQFTVSAADVGNFKLTNVSSPDPSSPFSLQSWDGTTEIGPTGMAGSSGSAAINIGVKPLQPGRDTGSFTITTDINVAGDTTRQISLAVTGIGSGVAVTPDSLDFGTASLGQTSLAQMLAVSNCQGSDLNLGAATITGKNANEFSIVIQPTSTTVTNTNSVTYGLVFLPTRSGIGSATLEIDLGNGGPPLTVSLIGAGTSAGESFGSATYYTCTTGGTAGWPIAAVVGFAIARRRRRR